MEKPKMPAVSRRSRDTAAATNTRSMADKFKRKEPARRLHTGRQAGATTAQRKGVRWELRCREFGNTAVTERRYYVRLQGRDEKLRRSGPTIHLQPAPFVDAIQR